MNDKKPTSGMVLDPRRQKKELLNPDEILKIIGVEGNMKFADFGCGAGYFTIPAARMVGEHGKVYAIDILTSELEDVRSKAKLEGLLNIDTIWADLEVPKSTKLKDGSVDIVLLSHVFYQSPNHKAILGEAKRVAKTSGKIIIVEWEKVDTPVGPSQQERVDRAVLIAEAGGVGLELISEFQAGSYHYGLALRPVGGTETVSK